MSRNGLFAGLGAVGLAIAFAATAQNYPGGQKPDPFSYEGNMVLEREQAAKAQAENDAMQKRLDENYKYYAPGGPGAPRTAAPRGVPPLKSRPLLAAANNPLLGLWRMGATRPINLGPVLSALDQGGVTQGAFGGGCANILGKPDTVIRFTPTQLDWVAPDGHDEILNKVEYRGDGANIIVIPTDSDLPLIFGMTNRDHAVVAFLGCTMSRTNTAARLGQQPAKPGAPPVAQAPATGTAILSMTVGGMLNGAFAAPPAGTQIYVTAKNPDQALVQAGFAGDASGPPIEKLFAACKAPAQGGNQANCSRGMSAMFAGALGAAATDPNGHAQTPAIPPGRYYLVGFSPYQGHALIWHLPIDLKAGANAVSLSPQNASISH